MAGSGLDHVKVSECSARTHECGSCDRVIMAARRDAAVAVCVEIANGRAGPATPRCVLLDVLVFAV